QERIAGGGTGRDLLSQRKSGNKVLVCRVKENDRRPQFAARPLVEFNPNQDDFTGSKGHGSAVRIPSYRQRMPPRIAADQPRAKRYRLRRHPTGVRSESVPPAGPAKRSQAER